MKHRSRFGRVCAIFRPTLLLTIVSVVAFENHVHSQVPKKCAPPLVGQKAYFAFNKPDGLYFNINGETKRLGLSQRTAFKYSENLVGLEAKGKVIVLNPLSGRTLFSQSNVDSFAIVKDLFAINKEGRIKIYDLHGTEIGDFPAGQEYEISNNLLGIRDSSGNIEVHPIGGSGTKQERFVVFSPRGKFSVSIDSLAYYDRDNKLVVRRGRQVIFEHHNVTDYQLSDELIAIIQSYRTNYKSLRVSRLSDGKILNETTYVTDYCVSNNHYAYVLNSHIIFGGILESNTAIRPQVYIGSQSGIRFVGSHLLFSSPDSLRVFEASGKEVATLSATGLTTNF